MQGINPHAEERAPETHAEQQTRTNQDFPSEEPAATIFMADIEPTRIDYTTTKEQTTESRAMKGSAPKEFDGDRKDSDRFLEEFRVYWKINRMNAAMKEPYSRVLMAISYMKGSKVRNWTRAQVKLLDDRVDNVGYSPADEFLWRTFEKDFKSAYTNTTEKQDAYVKLKHLQMTGDDLDSYTAEHEELVRLAEWDLDGDGSVEAFHNGLKNGLKLAILKRDDLPTTLEEWRTAAKKEQTKWALIKSAGVLKGGNNGRQDKWKNALRGKSSPKQRDPDAMDVDNVRLGPLTDEERKKLSAEGRCFRCRLQGHMSRSCPKRQQGQSNQSNANQAEVKPKSRITEIVDDRDDASEADSERTITTSRSNASGRSTRINTTKMLPDEIVRALEGLTEEERGNVLDQILLRGEDF